ncbi:hypothetical protein [Kamptonema formosum]|nr:hypothetical protein [Oscillatoria sp. PCC 10802]
MAPNKTHLIESGTVTFYMKFGKRPITSFSQGSQQPAVALL